MNFSSPETVVLIAGNIPDEKKIELTRDAATQGWTAIVLGLAEEGRLMYGEKEFPTLSAVYREITQHNGPFIRGAYLLGDDGQVQFIP